MRMMVASLILALTACAEERPPAPTAEENRQLDEAEAMLNDIGNQARPVNRPR